MTAQEHIALSHPAEALTELQKEIREHPEDPKLRIFLFQLYCVLGQWPKALVQLQVIAGIDPDTQLLAQIFQPVIQCESFRQEVFSGLRTPLILGEPLDWLSWLVKANEYVAAGQFLAAAELRTQAFEAAPVTPGTIGDKPFEWIADGDSRLGPVLELIMEGKYYWVPFCRIRRIAMEPPSDLRDLVWTPAQIVWMNGGEASGHIPTRYAGSEGSSDGTICLARRTDWAQHPGETFIGSGQRLLVTDAEDYPLLGVGVIDFATETTAPPTSTQP